jgi:diguanylate cyclase (GGDEF)-like protein/PAS domain S-box-containing protein
MRRRARYYLQFALLAVLAISIGVLQQGNVGDVSDQTRYTEDVLKLRGAEVLLDRDLLRITSYKLQQYDPLAQDIRRIQALLRRLRHAVQVHQAGAATGEAWRRWMEGLEGKLALAERIQSISAIERNELYYLSKVIPEYHDTHDREGNALIDLGHALLAYALFNSGTREQAILSRLDKLEAADKAPERANILHHVRRTLDYIGQLHEAMSRYAEVDTQGLFRHFYLQFNRAAAARYRALNQRRQWLAAMAGLLVLLLGWTLWGLARERRVAERSRRRLHDAIDSLSEGFALFNRDGYLVMHNRRFTRDYPWYREEDLRGLSYERFQAINREQGVSQLSEDGRDEGRAGKGGAYLECIPTPDGGKRWLLASDTLSGAGECVLVRVDVTEARQRELELVKLHRAVEQSPVAVVITNRRGDIEYVNPRFEQVTGYTLAEVKGRNPRLLKSGRTPAEVYAGMWAQLLRGEVWHGELVNRRKDGTDFWEEIFIAPVRDAGGRTTHYIAFKEDITERRRAEEAIRLHATVFEALNEGVLITDAQERILAVNPAFTRITGYGAQEAIGQTPRLLSSGHQSPAFYEELWQALESRGYWEGELEDRRKNGEIYPVWMSISAVRDSEGQVAQYISVFSDISERKEAERQIQYQASYDALTGLPNRHLFLDRVTHALHAAERERTAFGLLFIDLDRFKEVNDTLGHLYGDELLKQVSERLRQCVREADTISRFGGDEFVVLLEDVGGAENSAVVANKILKTVAQPLVVADREITVGASIGITHYPEDAGDAVTLLRNADMAMYRAKEAGRNNYQFYTDEMNRQVQTQVALARDLRQALGKPELFVVYQPIVQVDDRRLVGFEALLRWDHPQRGMVSPEQFIPLAEETGLIEGIGLWVLETACRQVAAWRAAGYAWRVGVNLSRRQIDLGLSVERLAEIIDRGGAIPADLTLEITEGLMLDGSDDTLEWLRRAQALGVHLSVDDFGTGYSSLSYLKRYPMNTLKIDRSFIRDIETDPNDASLVEASLAMARSLGLDVVAEGVENEAQLAFLEQYGCEYVQGWLFGKPMEPDQIDAFLARSGDRIKDY